MSATSAYPAPATLLLCHHGTLGAAAAEALACAVAVPGVTTVVHCLVVPELWAGMQGDDWLNDASTRDAFGNYVENMLENDARRELAAVEARCRERGLGYRSVLRFGEPAATVLAVAAEVGADLVVIGPPRRKGEEGLRSRLELDPLVRALRCPLLVAARP
ncbi:MAG: universal stress protein [Rhodocyclales bacterium]|nr:universal stress protein [Rhodocyclales bacterium]